MERQRADRASEQIGSVLGYSQAGEVAKATIVDVAAMVERVDQLLRNEQLRREFGESARRRIELLYAWEPIIDQYHNLWDEQWLVERSSAEPEPSMRLRTSTIFGAYATQVLEADAACEVTESDLAWLREDRPEAARLLGLDDNSPRSAIDSAQVRGSTARPPRSEGLEGVMWERILNAWKRGWCTVSEVSDSGKQHVGGAVDATGREG